MDINTINQMIQELTQCDTTYTNVRDLAALYTVRNNLNTSAKATTEKELSDILPAYQSYIDNKRKYQFKQLDSSAVVNQLEILCTEIVEFINSLYINTDSEVERNTLKRFLSKLIKKF